MDLFICKSYLFLIYFSMDEQNLDQQICQAVGLVSQSEVYQDKIFVFFCFIWSQVGLNGLISSIVLTNPLLYCNSIQSTQANYCQNILNLNSNCSYSNDFTGTFYANLYCENRDIRMTLQSIFAFGAVVGCILMPIFSDIKGKLISTDISLLCCIGGNFLIFVGVYYSMYLTIGVGLFSCAFGTSSLLAITYSINSDFLQNHRRQKAIIYYCASWGLSDMSIILVYYLIPDWWFYLIFLLFIPICCLYAYFKSFFLQSPHFLINVKSNYQAAKQVIKKLSEINHSNPQKLQKSIEIITNIQKQKTNCKHSIKKSQLTANEAIQIILHTPKYLKTTLGLILIKIAYYSFYYGVLGCLERIGFNFGVSVFFVGLGQFIGHLSGTFFIPKFPRKLVLNITNILSAIIGITNITQTVKQSPSLISITIFLCITLLSYNFSALTLVEAQSYDTTIRSTALGIQYGVSYMIRLVIPFGIGYFNERGIHPIIVTSIIIIVIGILPISLIQQTFKSTDGEYLLQQKQIELKIQN